jgi:hypothetical protein
MGTLLKAARMLLTALVASSGVLWHTTTAEGRFTPGQHNNSTNIRTLMLAVTHQKSVSNIVL